MIASTEYTGEDDCIDEAAGCFGSSHLEDDGERRGSSRPIVETRTVVRNVEAYQDHRNDIEEQNSPENILHHSWQVLGRVLGFASCDRDGFSPAI